MTISKSAPPKSKPTATADSTTISFSCLKADFDDVFKVFDDLLRGPEFRADKLDLAQKEYFDAISRRNDDVDGIVGREVAKLAYGAQNPYARVAEYKTVAAVTRQDLHRLAPRSRQSQQHHSGNRRRLRRGRAGSQSCARPTAPGPRGRR